MAGGAEAVLNLDPHSSIGIRYHSHFGPHDDILLLEVDEKLLPDILHQRVTVRGQPDEEAVLCTPSATYALKFVGTSNSVLLIPPANASADEKNDSSLISASSVIKVSPGSMELVQVAPKLDKLKSLLIKMPYKPEEEEDENSQSHQNGLYGWEDLVNIIQASDNELKAGLRALSAVEINGCWRIVDNKSMTMILALLLNNSVLYEWPLSALKQEEVVAALAADGYSRRIALHCLETYGNKDEKEHGCSVWSLDEKRVCLHFARQVLNGGKKKMENFIEEWTQSIPMGMRASLEMLEGEVLIEKIGVETWVRAFSVSSLPSTPSERFAALFHERPKWEWKDLNPYIRDLRVPGLSSEGLLIKYARRSQPKADAEPIFSAR